MKALFYAISTVFTLVIIVGGLWLTRGWSLALRMMTLTAAWLISTGIVTVLYITFVPFFKRTKKVSNTKDEFKQ